MNPYIRKIVELHKIHEAIENKSNNEGGGNESDEIKPTYFTITYPPVGVVYYDESKNDYSDLITINDFVDSINNKTLNTELEYSFVYDKNVKNMMVFAKIFFNKLANGNICINPNNNDDWVTPNAVVNKNGLYIARKVLI